MIRKEIGNKEYRFFGLVVGGIFLLMGLWPMLLRGEGPRGWAAILGGLLIALGIAIPGSLKPIYRIWMVIGAAMGWFNTHVILAIGFYGILTPIGLAMHLLGKDPMRRSFDPNAPSYRSTRSPRPGAHMQRQF